MIARILCVLMAALSLVPRGGSAREQPLHTNEPLVVTLMNATLSQTGVLRCTWRLKNNGDETIHVYSSYLKSSQENMVGAKDKHTLLILTTWLNEQRDTYPAYGFPEVEFINLDPGREITGTLERHSVSKRESTMRKKVSLVVGYMTNVEQFKADMEKSLNAGIEFQANPIVRWQKLQYSEPITLSRR